MLAIAVAVMLVGALGVAALSSATGVTVLWVAAAAWGMAVLAVMRVAIRSPRWGRVVAYRLTLLPDELALLRGSPSIAAGAVPIRVPRGDLVLRRPYVNEGGTVRYCELRLRTGGRWLVRARDRAVTDGVSGTTADLGQWITDWLAG